MLRDWFSDQSRADAEKAAFLVARICETGLPPFAQPKLLPPIEPSDIELVLDGRAQHCLASCLTSPDSTGAGDLISTRRSARALT